MTFFYGLFFDLRHTFLHLGIVNVYGRIYLTERHVHVETKTKAKVVFALFLKGEKS
jgi:hypothetical protein